MPTRPSSEAQALNAAIIYQIERALFLLFSNPTFTRVMVEHGDDLQLDDDDDTAQADHGQSVSNGAKIVVGQVKFTLTGENPFQNRSKGLWQTLVNWLRLRKNFHRYRDARFLAMANVRVSNESLIVEMDRISKMREQEEFKARIRTTRARNTANGRPEWLVAANSCVKKMRQIATERSSDKDLQACFTEFLAAADEDLAELVSRIALLHEEFEMEASDIEHISRLLQIPESLPRETIYKQLLQWFLDELVRQWKAKSPAIVGASAMREALEDFKRQARRKAERHRMAAEVDVGPIVVESYLNHTFLEKLRATGIAKRVVLLEAAESYFRTQVEKIRLMADSGCTQQEFDDLANQLHGRWKAHFSTVVSQITAPADQKAVLRAGEELYYRTKDDAFTVRFREMPVEHTYVRVGELHQIADNQYPDLNLWWKLRAEDMEDIVP